jgi:hypothetical protein
MKSHHLHEPCPRLADAHEVASAAAQLADSGSGGDVQLSDRIVNGGRD